MNKFLERYNLPRQNHEETESMNRSIERIETETVANSIQHLQKRQKWLFWNSFRKLEEGTLPNSPKRPPSLWYQNQRSHTKKSKLHVNITDEHRSKNPQQIASKHNPTIHYKDNTSWSSGIYPRDVKDYSMYTNHSIWYTILISLRIKTTWLSR